MPSQRLTGQNHQNFRLAHEVVVVYQLGTETY